MTKRIFKWMLVIFWMGMIFYFSSRDSVESMNQSRSVVEKTNVFGLYSEREVIYEDAEVEEADKTLRKVAHVVEYFVLTLLVLIALSDYNLPIGKIILYSFIVCLIYSITDEGHQLLVSGRSGELRDIIIDNIGTAIALIGFRLFKKVKA